MAIGGLGVDLTEVERVRRVLARHPGFLARCFTAAEQAERADLPDPAPRLAARFAAKEAAMKSLGCGWREIAWRDIEVLGPGEPRVVLRGSAACLAAARGVSGVLVSMSHTQTLAVAVAVAAAG